MMNTDSLSLTRRSWPRWVAFAWGYALAGLCTAAHAGTVQVDVLDAAGKPVADAVVFLDSAEASKRVKPLTGVEIAQEKKQFLPGLLVVPVGTEILFPNRDTVRHHVYSFSPAKNFELKLYTGTPTNPSRYTQVKFSRPRSCLASRKYLIHIEVSSNVAA